MVMTMQKNSPIQYLHASAMQERVRAAVAQSQVRNLPVNDVFTGLTTLSMKDMSSQLGPVICGVLPYLGSCWLAEQLGCQKRQK